MSLRATQISLTLAIVAVLLFVRLVITPLTIHLAGPGYTAQTYLSATPEEVFDAILLISWESISTAAFLFVVARIFMARSFPRYSADPPIALRGSQILYCAVALFGVVLLLAFGFPRGLINFFTIREGTVETERSALDMLSIQVMIGGTWLMYLLTIHRIGLRYRHRRSLSLFLIGLLSGVFVLMLIFGDRRSVQLYTSVAVIATLFVVFPDRKRSIVLSIVLAAVAVIVAVSFWRMFARHDIELTSATLMGPSFMTTIATALQSYTGGPFQIAVANRILHSESIGLENVVFDLLRSTFGVNFFVDRTTMLTSQILNDYIYEGNFLTGWLIFTASYGVTTVGPVFMPVYLILNILLALMCERIFRRSRGLEVKFLFIYLFSRMAFFPFTSTPILVSFFTLQLFTVGLIIFVAILIKKIDQPYLSKRSWP